MTLAPLAAEPLLSSDSRGWIVTFRTGAKMSDTLVGQSASGESAISPGRGRPQVAGSGGCRLLFDGRLHNGEELRHLLGVPPMKGEAELLLRAFQVWGRRLLTHLKGEFALVVVDERRREVLAARDRLGIYPLYYRLQEGELATSTTIESFGRARLQPDPAALSRFLSGKAASADSTLYRGVRRLPPGHFLVFNDGGMAVEQYWQLRVPSEGADWVGEEELAHFDLLLEQAVLRSAGEGRMAVFLSGGIDSVSVAAAAADGARRFALPDPLAVSLHYPGEDDEPEIQRAVAERLGFEHICLELSDALGGKGMLQAGVEISAESAQPLHNPWRPATNALARLAKASGCRSIVTGSGGDEWLTVDAAVTADYLLSGDLLGMTRYLSSVSRSLELSAWELGLGVFWRKGIRPLLRDLLRRPAAGGVRSRLTERSGPGWLMPRPDEGRSSRTERGNGSGHYATAVAGLPLHPLRAIELDEKFAAARELGLHYSDAYWDADLVEFLCRVPPHLLYRGGRTKGLVREKLAGRFPGLGFERQKKTVRRNLLGSMVLEEGEAVWRSLGGAQALSQLEIVEPRRLEEFVGEAVAARDLQAADTLWRIFNLESWARPRI